jgi:hypothetical protein
MTSANVRTSSGVRYIIRSVVPGSFGSFTDAHGLAAM